MMELITLLIICLSSFLVLVTTVAFLKAKDIYTMSHIVIIFNIYIVPLALLSIETKNFSFISILKIIAIGILNIIIVNIITNILLRRAMINKIYPDTKDAKVTKKKLIIRSIL